MRFTPQLRDLSWLVNRPIAHRGFHNQADVIENTRSAFAGAMAGDYAIECDVQISADGEAMVFHDDELGRLTHGKGLVKAHSALALQKMAFNSTSDRMQTLSQLLEQIDGRVTLIIEMKSLWDGDMALVRRCTEVLEDYQGPVALMSFDPAMVACAREMAPHIVRGITADRTTDAYYRTLSLSQRVDMRYFRHLAQTQPHFVSYYWRDLPFEPITEIRNAGHPVITWTLRSREESAAAMRYCDQVTFEGYPA